MRKTDTNFIKANNAKYLMHPMTPPSDMLENPPAIFTQSSGLTMTDIDGHQVLDAVGGLWNVNLGNDCPTIKQAITEQLDILPYTSTFRGQTNDKAIALSTRLVQMTERENMANVFFTQGGSDSVDTALRICRQYWKIQGKGEKFKFLSLKNGYHGTHMGGASVNGNPQFRQAYEPLMAGCVHLDAPWLYRNTFGETDADALCDKLIRAMEKEILFQGIHTIAGFIGEPVLGAGGVIAPPKEYWRRVQGLCNKYDILLIADEVITAFGRTGEIFGCRTYEYTPDIICFAKSITNGFFPLGGILMNSRITDTFQNTDSPLAFVGHGYTNSGNPVGCAAALATLDLFEHIQPHKNAKIVGKHLLHQLQNTLSDHPYIGDIRGKGLMIGIECVTDKDSKDINKSFPAQVAKLCYDAGLWIRVSGNIIILSPSLVITQSDADFIAMTIKQAVDSL